MQDAVKSGVGSGVVDARVGQAGARIDLDDVTKGQQIGEVDVTALDGGLGARAPDRELGARRGRPDAGEVSWID